MMKKVLLVLMVMVSLKGYSQIAISQLPTYTGNPSGGYVPIVIGGATKKIDAGKFTNGVALLASNNNFTGSVDTFKNIKIYNTYYGIDSTGYGQFNAIGLDEIDINGSAITTIGTDGAFTTHNNNQTLPTQQAVKTYVDAKRPYKVLSGWLYSTDTTTYYFVTAQNDLGGTVSVSKFAVGVLSLTVSSSPFVDLTKVGVITSTEINISGGVGAAYPTYPMYGIPLSSGNLKVFITNGQNYAITPTLSNRHFIEIRVYP